MAFTPATLNALKPKTKPYRLSDDRTRPGLSVQVSTGGKITFIFLYRPPDDSKRQRVMSLGTWLGMKKDGTAKDGGISIADVREVWAAQYKVLKSGRDPQVIRGELLATEQADRVAAERQCKLDASMGNIRQLLEAYTNDMREAGKRSWLHNNRIFTANVYGYIPETTKARDVTRDDINLVLAHIIERKAMVLANHVRAGLSAAFQFGMEWDSDPKRHFQALRFGLNRNPVKETKKPLPAPPARERALSEREVRQVWAALDDCGYNSKTIAALRLILALGGQRVEEVLKLKAGAVDFEGRMLTLVHTKRGTDHVIPFGDMAEPILRELVGNALEGVMFPKSKARKGSSKTAVTDSGTLSNATAKLSKRIGMEHFQPRDLRRTVKTLMGKAGIRKEDRDRFQNHALTDVSSRHYDRYDYLAEKRQVLAVWDAYLKNILAGAPKTIAVPFRAAIQSVC